MEIRARAVSRFIVGSSSPRVVGGEVLIET
jgi:hypothetical protein